MLQKKIYLFKIQRSNSANRARIFIDNKLSLIYCYKLLSNFVGFGNFSVHMWTDCYICK